MSDLVARLRVNGTSLYDQAADEIERLESELAVANAKIEAVSVLHVISLRLCRECNDAYPCPTIRALESATPKPADNGEDDQC